MRGVARIDLLFELNAAFERQFVLRQKVLDSQTGLPVRPEQKVPVDLTGYTARMQVRTGVGAGGSPLLDLTTENGGIELGGATGTIELYVSQEDVAEALTAHAAAGTDAPSLAHDFLLIQPGGDPRRLWRGSASVVAGVTVAP